MRKVMTYEAKSRWTIEDGVAAYTREMLGTRT